MKRHDGRRNRNFVERVCARCGRAWQCREDSKSRFCSPKCFQPDAATKLRAMSVDGPNGCRLWTGPLSGRYPVVRFDGLSQKANRLAWTFANGPIPDGMNVLHRCDNPACVNPDHLFVGTQRDNVRDMVAKDRAWWSSVVTLYDGTRVSLSEACQWLAVPYSQTKQRISKLGWTVGRALAAPKNTKGLHA